MSKKLKKEHCSEGISASSKEQSRVPLNSFDIAELSKKQCFRPDLYLNNGRHCHGCSFYKDCNLSLKSLPKYIMFDGQQFLEKKK